MKLLSAILMIMLALPIVYSVSIGGNLGINMNTEKFKPMAWLCDGRAVYDDNVERGRYENGQLLERINNYAFTGEQISWDVLILDKNGIEKVKDVFVGVGPVNNEGHYETQYYVVTEQRYNATTNTTYYVNVTRSKQVWIENSIEANCRYVQAVTSITQEYESCNARILEEQLSKLSGNVAALYQCTFNVEPQMYGEHWVTLEVTDLDNLKTVVDEAEYWFFNPIIALSIDGTLDFGGDDGVRPGTMSYSDTLLVSNDADRDSGVLLDMFITGTDFYDPLSSGAKCPTSNVLKLGNGDRNCDSADGICYYAVNGAYGTQNDAATDFANEGYNGIRYGDRFSRSLYNTAEIIPAQRVSGTYYAANLLAPGADMAITFRLNLPEPCNGDFSSGSIYFWGEAI